MPWGLVLALCCCIISSLYMNFRAHQLREAIVLPHPRRCSLPHAKRLLEALVPQAKTVTVPVQGLDLVSAAVDEHVQGRLEQRHPQFLLDQRRRPSIDLRKSIRTRTEPPRCGCPDASGFSRRARGRAPRATPSSAWRRELQAHLGADHDTAARLFTGRLNLQRDEATERSGGGPVGHRLAPFEGACASHTAKPPKDPRVRHKPGW